MMKKLKRYLKNTRIEYIFETDYDIDMLVDYIASKDNIQIISIKSYAGLNEVVKFDDKTNYIVWDICYWEYFEKFSMIIMSLCSNKFDDFQIEKQLKYLHAILYNVLSYKYYHIYPELSLIFAKESISFGFNEIDFDKSITNDLKTLVKLGKINLLSHELAHVDFDNNVALEKSIMTTVQNYLVHINDIEDLFQDRKAFPELNPIMEEMNNFIHGSDEHLLSELTDDIYSFIEGLLFISNDLKDQELIPTYLHGTSLLRWFNQFLDTADGVINLCKFHLNDNFNVKHPVIWDTNYKNFFRYTIHDPLMQVSFSQVYKEAGFTYEQFKGVMDIHYAIRQKYNEFVAPQVDYILRYELHHFINNRDTLNAVAQIKLKRKVIDFLLAQ